MNIKIENEKKAYVAPAMEIMSMEQNINLLTGSEVVIEDFEGVKDWDGEFN